MAANRGRGMNEHLPWKLSGLRSDAFKLVLPIIMKANNLFLIQEDYNSKLTMMIMMIRQLVKAHQNISPIDLSSN